MSTPFRVDGHRLKVFANELDLLEHANEFKAGIDALLHDCQGEAVVDLTACQYMSSMFIGILIGASWTAADLGVKLRFLVSERLRRYFDTGQLETFIDYVVAEETE